MPRARSIGLGAAVLATLLAASGTGCGRVAFETLDAGPLDGGAGLDASGPDAGALDGAGLDASSLNASDLDAGSDAGPVDGGCACGPCEVCAAGRCVPAADGTACGGGMCRAGACCAGCWDGASCVPGDLGPACGVGGGPCVICGCGTRCATGTCRALPAAVGIWVGQDSTFSLGADGQLWGWGQNGVGELGLGDTAMRLLPVPIPLPAGVAAASAAAFHTCVVLVDGRLFCWGFTIGTSPVQLGTDVDWDTLDVGVSSGCAIKTDSSLWCWGVNDFGELGLGDRASRALPTHVGTATWTKVSLGAGSTCGLQTDGSLWCWGNNEFGTLGLGDAGLGTERLVPTRVGAASSWREVGVSSTGFACAIDDAGARWCWGRNEFSTYAPDVIDRSRPERFEASGWVGLAAGFQDSCGLRSGTWTCVGTMTSGATQTFGAPMTYESVAAELHYCGIRSGGDAIDCFGRNSAGGLGTGDTVDRAAPTPVCR